MSKEHVYLSLNKSLQVHKYSIDPDEDTVEFLENVDAANGVALFEGLLIR